MAQGDINQVRQISGPLTQTGVNKELRLMHQRLAALEGRTDTSQVRDDLEVLGDVTATSAAVTSMGVGASTLTNQNLTQDPEIGMPTSELLISSPLGFTAPIEMLSPFSWFARDEFLSTGAASGTIGELGWQINNGTSASALATAGHPGVIQVTSSGAPIVCFLITNTIHVQDIQYVAAVIRPISTVADVNIAMGLLTGNPNAGVGTFSGIYWAYRSGSSPNWQTLTVSGGSTTNTTSTPAAVNSWVLLEIVTNVADATVDFFINRQRAFRHTTNLLSSTCSPFMIVESTGGVTNSIQIDKFLMSGKTPLSAKIYT